MTLASKEDWEETRERLQAWWRGEFFGRCAMAVCAPKKNPPNAPRPAPKTTPQPNADPWSKMYYGGEALPWWMGTCSAVSCIPSVLGCPRVTDTPNGLWRPMLNDPARIGAEDLRLDTNSPGYRAAMDVVEHGAREVRGKAFVAIGTLLGVGDTLAALRGTERLLTDCVERPEQVYAAEKHLNAIWMDYYERRHDVIKDVNAGGSINWLGVWSPGKYYSVQCDLSYNVGAGMFRELFLPFVREQTEFLDHSLYHLDGVNAFRHIDALLELPKLGAIQFFPGTNRPSALHYMDLLQKIQAAGKRLYLHLTPDEVEPALGNLSARLLYIQTMTNTEDEARTLLRNAGKWSVDR